MISGLDSYGHTCCSGPISVHPVVDPPAGSHGVRVEEVQV